MDNEVSNFTAQQLVDGLEFDSEVITEKERHSKRTGRTKGYNTIVIRQLSTSIIDSLKRLPENQKLIPKASLIDLWNAIRLEKSAEMPKNWRSHLKNELLLDINAQGFPIVKEKTASMQMGIKIDFNADTDRLEIKTKDFTFDD